GGGGGGGEGETASAPAVAGRGCLPSDRPLEGRGAPSSEPKGIKATDQAATCRARHDLVPVIAKDMKRATCCGRSCWRTDSRNTSMPSRRRSALRSSKLGNRPSISI